MVLVHWTVHPSLSVKHNYTQMFASTYSYTILSCTDSMAIMCTLCWEKFSTTVTLAYNIQSWREQLQLDLYQPAS